jgi:DNA/RNA-binding domain of Phe-tRNA-synthetase-like protein
MRFRVEESFHTLFPEAHIGIVVASGIDNTRNTDAAGEALLAAVSTIVASTSGVDLATQPAVAPWRDAYRRFGAKPSRYRSSIESLLRATRTTGIRSINPLVDCYNAVSLRHLLPCGGEDLDAIRGDLRLTVAAGGESFVPLGSTEELPPPPGEVVYADDAGVVCRAWNWREAQRTRLTPETTRAVLVIEALPPRTSDDVRGACDDLTATITDLLGGACRVALLGSNSERETSLDA